MTVQSLLQRCTELGIKLALKADDNDRLLVDAPRGTLTAPLREALTAHKRDLIAMLKANDQEYSVTQTRTPSQTSEETESQSSSASMPETTPLGSERLPSINHTQLDRTDIEVKKLLSGSKYDESIIDPNDSAARQTIAARLIEALGSRASDQHDRARQAFM